MPFVADEVIMQNVAQGSIYRSMPMPEVDRIVVGERYIDPDLPVVSELRAPETGFYEGIAAMSRRENSILSSFVNSTDALIEGEYDPDFNPFDEIKADGAEHYGDTLGHAFNKQHYDAMKEKLYQQERDIQLVEKSGTFTQLVGGVAAGAIDPLSYLGGGAALKLLKGRSALTQGAGIGFGSTAMPEIYLQATQELRTSEEAYWNVVGGSLLGAALGGGIQAYKATNRSTANKIIKKLRQDITRDTPDTIDVLRRQGMDASKVDTGKGVGADAVGRDINTARVYRQGIEDIMRGMEIKNAAGFQKLWKGMTPLMRSLNSPFVQTRFTMQKLLNTPFKLEKNAGGEATEQSIEKLAELYTDDYINAAVKTKDLYAKYKGSTSNALPRTRESLRNAFKKDSIPTSFHEEIGKAVRRNGKHPNAIIAESAKVWRKFFDDIGAEAVRSGIWKELPDRKVAESYFTRMFDKDAILDDAENYKNIVREYITEQTLKAVDSIEAKYTRMENGLQSQIDEAELNSFRKASQLQERAEIEGGELGLNIDDI